MLLTVLVILLILLLLLLSGSVLSLLYRSKKPENIYLFKNKKMSYRVLGNGRPVILLHGAFASKSWNGFDKLLAESYKVYIPEMPGFGDSESIPGAIHNTDLFTNALGTFISINKLPETPIIALSLGTIVTLKAAKKKYTNAPLILAGLPTTLSGKIFIQMPYFIRKFLAGNLFALRFLLLPVIYKNTDTNIKAVENTAIELIMQTSPQAIADPDYSEIEQTSRLVKEVRNRKIFVYGEKDIQKKNIKNITDNYTTLPNLGHNFFAESPKTASKVIIKILKKEFSY
jgi:pimeloyl-ACP methyl ester carboxylesterase